MAAVEPISGATQIPITLTRSAKVFGKEDFTLVLMSELTEQNDRYEAPVMRSAGGWLSGPIDLHVISASKVDDRSIEVVLSLRFETQIVPGCGASAVKTAHDMTAHLAIDPATGNGVLTLRD